MSEVETMYTAGTTGRGEQHVVIGMDRVVTVPEELKKIAVQYDHNIETVTFDCPRYWDEHDLSMMAVYVNYMRGDGFMDSCLCKNVRVDEEDANIMHFDWTISGNVTQVNGPISFLVCVKLLEATGEVDENGLPVYEPVNHWNSELSNDMYVSEGLECNSAALSKYPDVVASLLASMTELSEKCTIVLDIEEIKRGEVVIGHAVSITHGDMDEDGKLIAGKTDTINIMNGETFTPSLSEDKKNIVWTGSQGSVHTTSLEEAIKQVGGVPGYWSVVRLV